MRGAPTIRVSRLCPTAPGSGTAEVPLAPFDNVLILRQPEFVLLQTVQIVGQVKYPGTYALTSTLYVNGTFANVALRGSSGNADDVVLVGPGMTNASYGSVPYGIWSGGNVQGITIANVTIRDLYYHPIIFNGGTQSPRVYNVRLVTPAYSSSS